VGAQTLFIKALQHKCWRSVGHQAHYRCWVEDSMFGKLQTGERNPWCTRTASNPIYAWTLTGVCQAIRVFSPCFFHVFISTGTLESDLLSWSTSCGTFFRSLYSSLCYITFSSPSNSLFSGIRVIIERHIVHKSRIADKYAPGVYNQYTVSICAWHIFVWEHETNWPPVSSHVGLSVFVLQNLGHATLVTHTQQPPSVGLSMFAT